MNKMLRTTTWVAALAVALPASAGAQAFETIGTRAAGMGGAFVAVADDSSAVYWNPGGLALGSYFSLALDGSNATASADDTRRGNSRSGWLLALAMPALGLSYYRLRSSEVTPAGAASSAGVRLDTLVTHHSGATLVQSIVSGVSVGATLELIRGIASSSLHPDGDPDALLDEGAESLGRASNAFGLHVGVMAGHGPVKAGLTLRNLTESSFEAAGEGGALRLQRQARAGVALMPRPGWTLAADADLLRTDGARGPIRDVAVGAEGKVARRAFVRAGARFNTAGADARGIEDRDDTSYSLGGSFAVSASVLLDAQVTTGPGHAAHGWGIAGRFVY